MYYVYRFLDKKKNVIYVGKTKHDLEIRFAHHSHLPNECYAMVHKIEFVLCKTESDMSIKEIYYINKYKSDEHYFFNVLDITESPKSVEFDDKWKMYRGPLPSHFSRSINFKKGYTTEKEVRYNKDGSLDKRKVNKEKGVSSYVEGFDNDEINRIINYLIEEINRAKNNNQQQISFRNLVMFVLGINLPLRPSEFLCLKYGDIFDKKGSLKDYELMLGRHQLAKSISIPLNHNVRELFLAYIKKYNLFSANDAEEYLFISRKHQVVSLIAWGRILSNAAKAVGISKNIGAESVRKTYGLNIYKNSSNKMKALLFLGELWGHVREAKIIKYLGLTNDNINFKYFLGEKFTLGNVDLSKINCLHDKECFPSLTDSARDSVLLKEEKKSKRKKEIIPYQAHIQEPLQPTKIIGNSQTDDNRNSSTLNGKKVKKAQESVYTSKENVSKKKKAKNIFRPIELKKEIILKNLTDNITVKELANEYKVSMNTICNWITLYKKYGESGLVDRRYKNKTN